MKIIPGKQASSWESANDVGRNFSHWLLKKIPTTRNSSKYTMMCKTVKGDLRLTSSQMEVRS